MYSLFDHESEIGCTNSWVHWQCNPAACDLDCTSIYVAVLSDEEVNEILNLTRNRYRSWKSIGLELGIDSAALDAIEKNYVNDHRRLIAMIELWHSSVDLKPSRKAMESALQSEKVTLIATGSTVVF